jgi:hypothetical protein
MNMLEAWLEVLPIWDLKKTIQQLSDSKLKDTPEVQELIDKVEAKLFQRLAELKAEIDELRNKKA